MTNYTTKQLLSLKVNEVKAIAKNEYKLALSSNGKRFTKEELASSIMKSQSKAKRKETLKTKQNKTVYSGEQKSGKTHSLINLHNYTDYSNLGIGNIGKGKTMKVTESSISPIQKKVESEKLATAIINEMSMKLSPLDVNKVETIVAQSKKLLKSSKNNEELEENIRFVYEATNELRKQFLAEKKNMFQNKKRNNAISLMNVMINSYKKKLS
jgi:hypothetical protein